MKLSNLRAARIDRTRNNPFANPPATQATSQGWVMPVTAMSLVLGFMIAAAWVNEQNRSGRAGFLGPDQLKRVGSTPLPAESGVDPIEYQNLQTEVKKLRDDKTKLETAVATNSKGAKALNDSLQDTKTVAGLTELEGPGLVVTLRDDPSALPSEAYESNLIIHDTDVLGVVNEIFASGAEGVSVNGLRHVANTSYRCAGTIINVNGQPIGSPVVIRAIGDPQMLTTALNLPGGPIAQIRETNKSMAQIEIAKKIRLPAYGGATGRKLGAVPKDAK